MRPTYQSAEDTIYENVPSSKTSTHPEAAHESVVSGGGRGVGDPAENAARTYYPQAQAQAQTQQQTQQQLQLEPGSAQGSTSTDKREYALLVEGVPVQLWEYEDEASLEDVLETWTPPGVQSTYSPEDQDHDKAHIERTDTTTACCKLYTSLDSILFDHFFLLLIHPSNSCFH